MTAIHWVVYVLIFNAGVGFGLFTNAATFETRRRRMVQSIREAQSQIDDALEGIYGTRVQTSYEEGFMDGQLVEIERHEADL